MPEPWDVGALIAKARVFMNRAMDEQPHRPDDERALWASLALELLGKAALAGHSPALIATPNEEGVNLLAAVGLSQSTGTFNSIGAKTVYARCARAFPGFDDAKAGPITTSRNDYLHGAAVTIAAIPMRAWWPTFWGLAVVLVHACNMTIEEFIGPDRAPEVERHLSQNRENIKNRVEMLMSRARQMKQLNERGQLSGRQQEEWLRRHQIPSSTYSYTSTAECPVCGSEGYLAGEVIDHHDEHYVGYGAEDDYDVVYVALITTEYFGCDECRLELDGIDLIQEAGIQESFEVEVDGADLYEPEYGND